MLSGKEQFGQQEQVLALAQLTQKQNRKAQGTVWGGSRVKEAREAKAVTGVQPPSTL